MSSTVVKDVEKVNSIVWFRNDLRAIDHSGLSHAIENSKNVIGVYCFNPHQFNIKFQAERYNPNNKFQNLWLQEKLSLF